MFQNVSRTKVLKKKKNQINYTKINLKSQKHTNDFLCVLFRFSLHDRLENAVYELNG